MLPAAKEISLPKSALRPTRGCLKGYQPPASRIPNYPRLGNDAGYLKLVYPLFPKFLFKEK
ncbi:hypothetical protein EIKCOROL_00769 [Eikenella corrodens ATCC 23834]|uniref:Uncharacterized protein n=1 Tax=Eikenella corrodens ATCC 23834 TaxID=546274 RepID=C0DTT9_EIKCO|nr:hypothetical protein EIKCOROL_00769 [Eikenella corrodens ATCC 23834]